MCLAWLLGRPDDAGPHGSSSGAIAPVVCELASSPQVVPLQCMQPLGHGLALVPDRLACNFVGMGFKAMQLGSTNRVETCLASGIDPLEVTPQPVVRKCLGFG